MTEPLFPQPLLAVLADEPGRTAFEAGDRHVSYRELLGLVHQLAASLQAAGLGPRSGLAIHTGLTVEGFAANVAAHALGCRVVAVRPAWSSPQLTDVLADGVDVLVGDPSTLTPPVLAAAEGVGLPVLSLDPSGSGHFHPHDSGGAAVATKGGRVGSGGGSPPRTAPSARRDGGAPAGPDDIARVTFTSGSTGRPKGCAYTYRTLSLTYRPDRRAADLARLVGHFRRFLANTSWAVPVRLVFAGRCLLNRGTVVIHDPDPDVDPTATLAQAIERHRITAVTANVPSMTRLLAEQRGTPRDLASLEALVVAGSPVGPGLLAAAVEQLGPVVWQGYGQAESGMISLLTPEDIAEHAGAALVTVGRPLPDVDVEVRDTAGRVVAPGELGEVHVRSPHVMAGYWNAPKQTVEVLSDGWLNTRDLGRLDGNGLLQLTGRSRDVIMVNAEVCYAGAIEAVLMAHPDVEQAYVVARPDDATGEAVHAFVVLTPGATAPDRATVDALVRAHLTPAHVPQTVTVLTAVPLTPAGKPDKQALTTLAHIA